MQKKNKITLLSIPFVSSSNNLSGPETGLFSAFQLFFHFYNPTKRKNTEHQDEKFELRIADIEPINIR